LQLKSVRGQAMAQMRPLRSRIQFTTRNRGCRTARPPANGCDPLRSRTNARQSQGAHVVLTGRPIFVSIRPQKGIDEPPATRAPQRSMFWSVSAGERMSRAYATRWTSVDRASEAAPPRSPLDIPDISACGRLSGMSSGSRSILQRTLHPGRGCQQLAGGRAKATPPGGDGQRKLRLHPSRGDSMVPKGGDVIFKDERYIVLIKGDGDTQRRCDPSGVERTATALRCAVEVTGPSLASSTSASRPTPVIWIVLAVGTLASSATVLCRLPG